MVASPTASVADDLGEGFKPTELGPLPYDWRVASLGEICDIQAGGSAPQGDNYFGGTLPFVRVQHLSQDSDTISRWDLITEEAVRKYSLRLFPKGTVVFPKSGASIRLEKRAILPVDAYVVSHLCALLPSLATVEPTFLFHLLRATHFADDKADGYPTLTLTEIKSKLVPLPPLSEQRTIAHVLSSIQRSIQATDCVIAAVPQLKRSLMRYLFTYGPVPLADTQQVPLKETEIGLIPEHWGLVRLGDVLKEPLRNGHSAKRSNSDVGLRTLTLTAVTQNDFTIENTKLTSAETHQVRDLWLKRGDLFIERANTPEYVGLAALYEGDDNFAIFPDLLVRVRVHEERIIPKFLAEFLLLPIPRSYFQSYAKKTAGNFPKIDQPIIENTLIPDAPAYEQSRIVGHLKALDAKLDAEEKRKASLQQLLRTMLHLLMTGRLRFKDLDFANGPRK